MNDQEFKPWVVVGRSGVVWIGHAKNEKNAWVDALGWPTDQEIADRKNEGWYASEATVSWTKPSKSVV